MQFKKYGKQGRLAECFYTTLLIVIYLYDFGLIYEFLFDNRLYLFIHLFSHLLIPVQHHGQLNPLPGTSPGQDNLPSQDALTHTSTFIQTGTIQTRQFIQGTYKICAQLWDVGENLYRHGENMKTPHREWLQPENFFVFSSML